VGGEEPRQGSIRHGADDGGSEHSLDLFEIAVPDGVDDLQLTRWCFFLWDGGDDLRPIDWLSNTWHQATEDFGFGAGELSISGLDLYLRLFCAFVCGGDDDGEKFLTPFLLIGPGSTPAGAGTMPPARPGLGLARTSPEPEADAGREPRPPRRFDTPSLSSGEGPPFRVLYGNQIFLGQFRLTAGPGADVAVEMLDDEHVDEAAEGFRPLFVKRWGSINFLCRGVPRPAQLGLASGDLRTLLESPATIPAATAGAIRRSTRGDAVHSALCFLARSAWGGPGPARMKLTIAGSHKIGAPGATVKGQVWLRAPPRVEIVLLGDLEFEERRFSGPLNLSGWRIRGIVRGQNARFDSALVLEDLRVDNLRLEPARGGRGFGEGKRPSVAVDLSGARCRADVNLDRLRASGTLSLERLEVRGQLKMEDAEIRRTDAGKPALSANHMAIGASADLASLYCESGASLEDLRIGGNLDLSGALITMGQFASRARYQGGLQLARSRIGGNLIINRLRDGDILEQLTPTLVGGELVLEGVEVKGSIHAALFHVWGHVSLDGARVGRDIALTGSPGLAGELVPLACLSVIADFLSLHNVRTRGTVTLSGIKVASWITLAGLQARVLHLPPDPLPLYIGDAAAAPDIGVRSAAAGGLFLRRASLERVQIEAVQLAGDLAAENLRVTGEFAMGAGWCNAPSAEQLASDVAALWDTWLTGEQAAAGKDSEPPGGRRNEVLVRFRGFMADRATTTSVASRARVAGNLRINNLRTEGDVILGGLESRGCEVRDCHIGGDLKIRDAAVRDPLDTKVPAVRLGNEVLSLDLTGNEIEGRIALSATNVGKSIDLSHTHAKRGLVTSEQDGPEEP